MLGSPIEMNAGDSSYSSLATTLWRGILVQPILLRKQTYNNYEPDEDLDLHAQELILVAKGFFLRIRIREHGPRLALEKNALPVTLNFLYGPRNESLV